MRAHAAPSTPPPRATLALVGLVVIATVGTTAMCGCAAPAASPMERAGREPGPSSSTHASDPRQVSVRSDAGTRLGDGDDDPYFHDLDRRDPYFEERTLGDATGIGPGPHWSLVGTVSPGAFDYETTGSNLDDRTESIFARGRLEGTSPHGLGAGLSLEWIRTDDDLFATPTLAGAEARTGDLFFYFLLNPRRTALLRFPVRIGPYFHGLELEDPIGDDITWGSFGGRVEVGPEFVLYEEPGFEMSLFAELSGGVHGTRIEVDSATGALDRDFDTSGYTAGIDAGARVRMGALSIGVSYLQRDAWFDESDPEGGVVVREVEARTRGVAVEFGVRF